MCTRCDGYDRGYKVRLTQRELKCVYAPNRAANGCDHVVDTKVFLHEFGIGIHPIPCGDPRETHLEATVSRTGGEILPQLRVGKEIGRDNEVFLWIKRLARADDKFIIVVIPSKVLKR